MCYSPGEPFENLNSAIQRYVEREQLEPSLVFVWIDGFSIRRGHSKSDHKLDMAALQTKLTLAILEPWHSPGALTDAHCIKALATSVKLDCQIVVAMSGVGQNEFRKGLVVEGVEHVHNLLSTVEAAGGEAIGVDQLATIEDRLRDSLWTLTVACDVLGLVWIDDAAGEPALGEVTSDSAAGNDVVVTVSHDRGEPAKEVNRNDLRHANPPAQNMANDLTHLDFMSDLSLLNTLRHRYCGGNPRHTGDHSSLYCTFIGNILIYVNPYAPNCSTGQVWKNDFVLQDYVAHKTQVRATTMLRPHAYTIADLALSVLINTQADQAIYVAGESGAGKTEACKMVMQYLLAAASAPNGTGALALADVLARSDFVMEAMGNARTINNPNSSRFVKYLNLTITHSGELIGATVNASLLEKTRVCRRSEIMGANFHIFDYMGDPHVYQDPSQELSRVEQWLGDIGFDSACVHGIRQLLRVVALLEGMNVQHDGSFVEAHLLQVSRCLGVPADDFVKQFKLAVGSQRNADEAGTAGYDYVKALTPALMRASKDPNSISNRETLEVGAVVKVLKRETLPLCGTVRVKVKSQHWGGMPGWVTEKTTDGAMVVLRCGAPGTDATDGQLLDPALCKEQADSIISALSRDLYDALFDAILQQFNARIGESLDAITTYITIRQFHGLNLNIALQVETPDKLNSWGDTTNVTSVTKSFSCQLGFPCSRLATCASPAIKRISATRQRVVG